MKIIVLGAGLVGTPIALDLATEKTLSVTLVDINEKALKRARQQGIRTEVRDLSNPAEVSKLVALFDFVVSAVPGFMGYRTLEAVIEAGKNVVDIAFFPEDPFQLHEKALKNKVTAIVDCGVAPGMSHILTGYAQHLLDSVQKVRIYVGGLPLVRKWPYEYKAVFSPLDVIEEYTRPARVIENGKVVVKEALSEAEYLDFPQIGTLEAFNSDGLRTLTRTIDAPDMCEKTLRYPGHIQLMQVLRHSGFFAKEKININGNEVSPLDVTAKLLQKDWKLNPGEQDLTVMKIQAEGKKGSDILRYTYDLLDYFDVKTNIHSMARTTGYTAAVVARLAASGKIDEKGIVVPEYLGKHPQIVQEILLGLKERGIEYRESIEKIL